MITMHSHLILNGNVYLGWVCDIPLWRTSTPLIEIWYWYCPKSLCKWYNSYWDLANDCFTNHKKKLWYDCQFEKSPQKTKNTHTFTTIGHRTSVNNKQSPYRIVGNKGPELTNIKRFKRECGEAKHFSGIPPLPSHRTLVYIKRRCMVWLPMR